MKFSQYIDENTAGNKEDFDPREVSLGLEDEKSEHMDIWTKLQNWAEDNDYQLPFSEDTFFDMIVKAHLKEHPKYYTEFADLEQQDKYYEIEKEEKREEEKYAGADNKKISGKEIQNIDRIKESVDIFDKHKKQIALKTLKMNDVGASVMGGMSKKEALEYLMKIGYSKEQLEKILTYNGHSEDEISKIL